MTRTVKQQIAMYLHGLPCPVTATGIQRALANSGYDTKLSTVSSILHRLSKDGILCRVEKFGPRGGYGYIERDRDRLREIAGIPRPAPLMVHSNPIAELYISHAGWREK